MDKIRGVVERVIYKNRENNYNIISVEVEDGGKSKSNTVTIYHPSIIEGFTYHFEGEWTSHPKFGHQFAAKTCEESRPGTLDGLIAYLSSRTFPGIGPAFAKKIVNHFEGDIFEILDNDIERLEEIKGLSKKKVEKIKESWKKNGEINVVMTFLQSYSITPVFAAKIYEVYGKGCIEKIKKDPYSLAKNIKGIGFKYADNIALQLGFDKKVKERIECCIDFVVSDSGRDGHAYMTVDQVINKSLELLSLPNEYSLVKTCLDSMILKGEIYRIDFGDGIQRIYSRILYHNETFCAKRLMYLKKNTALHVISEDLLKGYEGINLSDEQKEAVLGIPKNGVSILTGGPGVGKTATTKALVHVLKELGVDFALAAPTGRAAQRMSESIGEPAKTIHRMLGIDMENGGGFLHGLDNPFEEKFIIIDEASMIDINLGASLLRAVDDDAQILFIGDIDQLPPVGPGNFFRDMVLSQMVKTFSLTKIFRQAQASNIINFSHQINKGNKPKISSPMVDRGVWDTSEDFLFIESGFNSNRQHPKTSTLFYNINMIQTIDKLFKTSIKEKRGLKDIQILTPMKIGDLGSININDVIQNSVNPLNAGDIEVVIGPKKFRNKDKVIHTVNNYDLDVFNGDIGYITSISEDGCTVMYDNDKEVEYTKSNMIELDLAYAISIHKSQGSEFECVIVPIHKIQSRMLYKNLVYTAITRAKKLVVMVGEDSALEKSINTIQINQRQSSLIEMMKEVLETKSV